MTLMTRLKACCQLTDNDPELWAVRIIEYHKRIAASYSADVIRRAFEDAPNHHPRFFPNLGELVSICKAVEKNLGLCDTKALPAPRHDDEPLSQAARHSCRYVQWVAEGRQAIADDPEFEAFCKKLETSTDDAYGAL